MASVKRALIATTQQVKALSRIAPSHLGRAGFLIFPILFMLSACDGATSPWEAEPKAIAVEPAAALVDEGGLFEFRLVDAATATRPEFRSGSVVWHVDDPAVASVHNGRVRGLSTGTTTVTAVTPTGLTAQAEVEVARVPQTVQILDGSGMAGVVGESLDQALRARVVNGSNLPVAGVEVRFKITRGAGSMSPVVGFTDEDGRIESRWTLGPVAGRQEVEVQVVSQSEVRSAVAAQAAPGEVHAVRVTPGQATLRRGSPFQFTAALVDAFGNKVDEVAAAWTSSNPDVAQVTDDGWVTGLQAGRIELDAVPLEDGGGVAPALMQQLAQSPGQRRGKAHVEVEDEEGNSQVTVAVKGGDGQTGLVGQRLPDNLEIEVTGANGVPIRQTDVRWSVSSGGGSVSEAVTRTNGQGRASVQWTLGTVPGDYTVTATLDDHGSATFSGKAIPGEVAHVEVTPGRGEVEAEEELDFDATAWDEFGNRVTRHGAPQWAVGNNSVASINSQGRAKGLSQGDTEVQASIDGVSGTASLEVQAAETELQPASVTVSPASAEIEVDEVVQLAASVRDANGIILDGVELEWASLSTSIATVNSEGRVLGKSMGTALIVVAATCCSNAADTATVAVFKEEVTLEAPGQVTDLSAVSATDDAVTLRWTQVDDGTGKPANYAVRHGSPEITWGAAHSTEVSVDGTGIGSELEYKYNSLDPDTDYQFQLVAYRGTLNEDAEFGDFSNIESATTDGGSEPDGSGGDGDGGSGGSGGDGSGGGSGSSGVTPLFYDGFESGDHAHSENGYSWGSTSGSPDHIGDGAPVREGEWASRFRQLASCGNSTNRMLQLRADSRDQYLDEFWFEYWIWIPGPGAPDGEDNEYDHSCDGNNKWAEFFHKEDRGSTLVAPNTLPNSSGDGGSSLRTFVQITGNNQALSGGDDFVATSDRGKWVRYRYHLSRGTVGQSDGKLVIWKNDEKVYENLSADISSPSEDLNSFGVWQIMGWDNSGWPERITWYVDEVRLYDRNPGW
jgi:uncharacterized protein YjdB